MRNENKIAFVIAFDNEGVIKRHANCKSNDIKYNIMKTIYLKISILIVLLGVSLAVPAQALLVKGHIKNNDNETTTAYYTLSNSYEMIQVGKCSDLKFKLGYNDCYTITFSKPGCRSKTITISTFSKEDYRCEINFIVTLEPLAVKNIQEPELYAGKIYYDKTIRDYNYISCCGQELKESKKECASREKVYYVSR
ncbi:hypothetical protein CNR22_22920 [Sphingobacteriaceae bacterium]|nr:hypothetical protein CNR22_22920 [Sphingobacteriaceae bacterium]